MTSVGKKENKYKGDRGEAFARSYLIGLGWVILEAPFRCRIGELDIIALDQQDLVFVEVKSRMTLEFGDPIMAVNRTKQKKIIRMARFFLASRPSMDFRYCRFDVLGLIPENSHDSYQIRHIRDAFRLEPEDMAFSY